MKLNNKRKGFTLVELLVVVLILAILTAVALPLYLRSVRDAEENACKTNMKTIANAVQAHHVRNRTADYFSSTVDAADAAVGGDLEDLQNFFNDTATTEIYTVTKNATDGRAGFKIDCGYSNHSFYWEDGTFK
jgi:prepilin-type N-terminal cleavage/methylation domain-containing protein